MGGWGRDSFIVDLSESMVCLHIDHIKRESESYVLAFYDCDHLLR